MRQNHIQNYYPANKSEMDLMKISPIWLKITEIVSEEFDLEASLLTELETLEEMKARAFATYHYELSCSATRGEQEFQGKEYAFREMLGVINSFFNGFLTMKNVMVHENQHG